MKRLFLCFIIISSFLNLLTAQEAPANNENISAAQIDFRLQARWGLSFLGQGTATNRNASHSVNGISSSQIIHQIGIGAQLSFSQFLGIAPSIDLYLDEYIYLSDHQRAFPTQIQTGSSLGPLATVLAVGINLPWYMSLPIGDLVHFNLAAGPGIILRIPIIPLDGSDDITPIGDYTLGEGRWLNFYLETGFSFRMAEWFGFSLAPRVILPIWHIWDSYDIPFYDHLLIGLGIGLEFYF